LDASTTVTSLENAALAADPNFQTAQTNLNAARGQMSQVEANYQTILAQNRALQQAKVDFDAATAQHTTALAQVESIDQVAANELKAQEDVPTQPNFNAMHQQNVTNNQYPGETQAQRDADGH
jgi:hypothetical protein